MTLEKILNNKNFIIFVLPFFLGLLSVFSFQPFNFTFVNFFTIPGLFLTLSYVQKRYDDDYRNSYKRKKGKYKDKRNSYKEKIEEKIPLQIYRPF